MQQQQEVLNPDLFHQQMDEHTDVRVFVLSRCRNHFSTCAPKRFLNAFFDTP
jgi:hypothetical protein